MRVRAPLAFLAVAAAVAGCADEKYQGWSFAATSPIASVAGPEGAWVLTASGGEVELLSPTGARPARRRTVALGGPAEALGLTAAQAVAVGESVSTAVDRRTGRARPISLGWRNAIDFPSVAVQFSAQQDELERGPVASDGRRVWVAVDYERFESGSDNLYAAAAVSIDPRRPGEARTIRLGVELISGLAADSEAVFATSRVSGAGGGGAIARTHQGTGRVEARRALPGASGVAVAGGSVWVVGAGRLHRLDPRTLAPRGPPIEVERALRVAGEGSTAWVHAGPAGKEVLVRLDAGGRELGRSRVPGYSDEDRRFTGDLSPDVESLTAAANVAWMDELSGVVYRFRAP